MENLNYSNELKLELKMRINELEKSINTANSKSEDLDEKIRELNILQIKCKECIK